MAKRAVIQVDVEADASDAVAGFDDAARAADRMGSAMDDAGRKVDTGADRVNAAADAADNLDDKTGRATGALGALSSGFELVGAEKYAGALQGAAMATDFFSGVGQALTLVLESEKVQLVLTRVQTVALGVAQKVTSAATKAFAVATRVLNAAMRANPMGVAITLALALAGVFVLLWKRSTTFRTVVLAVWAAVRKAFDVAVSAIRKVVDVAWGAIKTALSWSPIGLLARVWGPVAKVLEKPFRAAASAIEGIVKGLGSVMDNVLAGIIGAINTVVDAINAVIRAANKAPGVNIPTIPTIPTSAAPSSARVPFTTGTHRYASPAPFLGPVSRATVAAPGGITINVHGAVDPEGTARQIRALLDRHATRMGR